MAITASDKIKINRYLNTHAIGNIYYLDLCDALCKKGKVSDVEFLEFFTDSVINEFRKNSKVSIKHVTKLILVIGTFLDWIHEDGSKVQEEILDKIRNFKDFYEDYLNRTGLEEDLDFSKNCIDFILQAVNELYPSEVKNESLVKYINKIEELEKQSKELRKKLVEVSNLYDALKKNYDQKAERVETLNNQVANLGSDNRNKEKELLKLSNEIEKLNDKISELETFLEKAKGENEILIPYKEQFEILTKEVEELKRVIEEEERKRIIASNLVIKQNEIEAYIYQKLLLERVSIDEILKYVQEQGFATDKNEIIDLLKRIKSRINIDSSYFSFEPTYKITSPSILKNGQFSINIPFGCKYYDIMLVSDFHIKKMNNKVLSGFDLLNDYCVKNGISLILNLGDFYHGIGNLDYYSAINNYKTVEESIKLIPKVEGLYHAVLGGNHDRNVVKYGFDPLQVLSAEREDFINLGYIHSTISLTDGHNLTGKFDLHHPDTFDFPIDLDENGIDMRYLDGYLKDIYSKLGRDRNDSYIDIFGHTHKSQFNHLGSYCYIPSYFEGQMKRGACHLRIYFDEVLKIKYMVFMPLSYSNQLIKNNEIIYKKTLNK